MASRGRESAASGHLHSFLFFFSFHPFTLSSVLAWFQGAGSVSFRRSWVIMLHLLSSLLFLLGRISAKRRRMHFLKATPALLCAPYNLYLSASLDLSLSLSSLFFFLPLLAPRFISLSLVFPWCSFSFFFYLSLPLSMGSNISARPFRSRGSCLIERTPASLTWMQPLSRQSFPSNMFTVAHNFSWR